MSVAVIDRAMQPLGSALAGQLTGAKDVDMTAGHQVVICSEQQIKVGDCVTCCQWHCGTFRPSKFCSVRKYTF